ncbi:hypothetical protein QVD17_18256 [Tagetes erecta]|uniref:Uncharacterized protein n=1 Tax=Tagetes erecta TaxID=13708 RepID=A0AAD8KHS3_TARER|nr:hypothetical protein QVD17_18256 [Tagetes erecta]
MINLRMIKTIYEQQTLFPASSSSLDPTILTGMPCSSHNLIQIHIHSYTGFVGATIISSNVLKQLERLDKIDLYFCGKVNEVFKVATLDENESQIVVNLPIPNLTQVKLRPNKKRVINSRTRSYLLSARFMRCPFIEFDEENEFGEEGGKGPARSPCEVFDELWNLLNYSASLVGGALVVDCVFVLYNLE